MEEYSSSGTTSRKESAPLKYRGTPEASVSEMSPARFLRVGSSFVVFNLLALVAFACVIVWLTVQTLHNRDDLDKVKGFVSNGNVLLTNKAPRGKNAAAVIPLFEGSGYWAERAEMPFERSDHQVAAVGEVIYIVGGFDSNGSVRDDVTVYDTVLDSFSAGPNVPVPIHRFGMAVLQGSDVTGGKIYVVGGLESSEFSDAASGRVHVLDLADMAWSRGPDLNTPRSDLCAYAVDGKVYAAGGWSIGFLETLSSVEVLDPEKGTWEFIENMPTPRGDAKCGSLEDHKLIVAGGFYDPSDAFRPTHFRREVEMYDTLSGTWIKLADYPFARGDFALATLPGNRLLAVGGEMNGRGRTNAQTQASHQVNEYIGDHDIWVPKVPIPGPRFRMDAAYVDGVVYVFGGHAVCVGQDCPETATTQAYFDFDHPDIFLLQAE